MKRIRNERTERRGGGFGVRRKLLRMVGNFAGIYGENGVPMRRKYPSKVPQFTDVPMNVWCDWEMGLRLIL